MRECVCVPVNNFISKCNERLAALPASQCHRSFRLWARACMCVCVCDVVWWRLGSWYHRSEVAKSKIWFLRCGKLEANASIIRNCKRSLADGQWPVVAVVVKTCLFPPATHIYSSHRRLDDDGDDDIIIVSFKYTSHAVDETIEVH